MISRSRRPNGATQTFRRPSAAQTSTTASRENPSIRNSVESVPAYIPPHRNGTSSEYRYSKDQLLSLFRAEKEAGNLNEGLSSLFVGGWESNLSNGINTSPWARRDEQRDTTTGADICWDKDGSNPPLGLKDLTIEEKEVRD
jgi:PERQ amino acid-rich with GYF domain-containing protein